MYKLEDKYLLKLALKEVQCKITLNISIQRPRVKYLLNNMVPKINLAGQYWNDIEICQCSQIL